MRTTCDYTFDMQKMIQIRNVPEPIHRILKSRAALMGLSLSDYLLEELTRSAQRPTLQEVLDRIAGREPVQGGLSSADAVRAERDGR